MKKTSTTVYYSNLLTEVSIRECISIDLEGYYVNAERGSYIYNEGGSPDLPASFDVHSIKINDVEMIDNLTESFIDELVEMALINLK